jgi:large subunit ribosomal protein L24
VILRYAIRKNDQVVVEAGRDRGKRGKVLRVVRDRGRAIVEGVNMVKRHTRPNPSRNIKGGVVEREGSIQVSNLMLICGECDRPTRPRRRRLADGRKVRVCHRCDGVIDK